MKPTRKEMLEFIRMIAFYPQAAWADDAVMQRAAFAMEAHALLGQEVSNDRPITR